MVWTKALAMPPGQHVLNGEPSLRCNSCAGHLSACEVLHRLSTFRPLSASPPPNKKRVQMQAEHLRHQSLADLHHQASNFRGAAQEFERRARDVTDVEVATHHAELESYFLSVLAFARNSEQHVSVRQASGQAERVTRISGRSWCSDGARNDSSWYKAQQTRRHARVHPR